MNTAVSAMDICEEKFNKRARSKAAGENIHSRIQYFTFNAV